MSLIARNSKDLADTATVPVIVSMPGQPPQVSPLPEVTLDSLAAEIRIDLDEFVFDADDFDSEVVMVTDHDLGVTVVVDPVTHELIVRRVEESGLPLPNTSVRVSAVDTDGGTSVTRILAIQLPPIFTLSAIPDITFFEGEDETLYLDSHVAQPDPVPSLSWSTRTAQHFDVRIDPLTHRAFIKPLAAGPFALSRSASRSRSALSFANFSLASPARAAAWPPRFAICRRWKFRPAAPIAA